MDCDKPHLRETDLIDQLTDIIEDTNLDKSGIKEKFESEIDRLHKFQLLLGKGIDDKADTSKELDMRDYAKHILKEGSIYEKRNLPSNLKSKITIKEKNVTLD